MLPERLTGMALIAIEHEIVNKQQEMHELGADFEQVKCRRQEL